jgi:o-succinylbenzoate synthase
MKQQSLSIRIVSHPMRFLKPARTSRDVLKVKPTWFIVASDSMGRRGLGECSLIPGLNPESIDQVEKALQGLVDSGELNYKAIPDSLPAVRFAVEMAKLDLEGGGRQILYDTPYSQGTKPIEINGLIWMDSVDSMLDQAQSLIAAGFKTLKMKVGTLPFSLELEWLSTVRAMAPVADGFQLRLDANGAFSRHEAGWSPMQKLEALAKFEIHSIEQPLSPLDQKGLAELCEESPVPIALDESLIGQHGHERRALLELLKPAFIVLKPSLIGGFERADEWVALAEEMGLEWWATSALESNIGLNAIAQWTARAIGATPVPLAQGLGTGGLFENNIPSPLSVDNGFLHSKLDGVWDFSRVHDFEL